MPYYNEELHRDLYNIFLEQDYENDYFDVIFHVQGKELYAHGLILSGASPIFKEQLLHNRSKGNPPIRIDDYTYDEFYEFLRLIYYDCFCVIFQDGEYVDMEKDIHVILKLVNAYEAESLKHLCLNGHFGYSINNIQQAYEEIELAYKNSAQESEELEEYVDKHFLTLIENNGFLNLEKSGVKAFVYYAEDGKKADELCKAVYKWGEHQAMVNDGIPEEEKIELVLHYIKDILPSDLFKMMSIKFLFEFAVPKDLISVDKAKEYKKKYVQIRYKHGSLTGSFIDDYGIYDMYLKDELKYFSIRNHHHGYVKDKKFKIPSKPSELKKMKGCEWYLLFERNGTLAIKHESMIKRNEYLIAEMKSPQAEKFECRGFNLITVSHKNF